MFVSGYAVADILCLLACDLCEFYEPPPLTEGDDLAVIGGRFTNNGMGLPAELEARSGIKIQAVRCKVVGATCMDTRPAAEKTQEYGIAEISPANSNIIVDNVVVDNKTAGIERVGELTILRGNLGHRTENRGTATIAAGTTSVTVPHRLVATPYTVVALPRDVAVGAVACTARDATNITLTCEVAPAVDVVVDWYAEV